MEFYDEVMVPEHLVYLAGAFYVAGLAITNQIVLRLFLLAGTVIYLFYYFTIADRPLWEAIYVSVLIGAANIGGLTTLIARRSRLAIPRAHADIYDAFPHLPPGDFRALMKLARRRSLDKDIQVTVEGKAGDKLFFILDGSIVIHKSGHAFVLPAKLFIGEVAFLTGVPSSASAWIAQGSEILEWTFADLNRKCARNPRFKLALEAAISIDLADKVARSMGRNSVDIAEIPRPMVEALAFVETV